jgi:hypothetical protein
MHYRLKFLEHENELIKRQNSNYFNRITELEIVIQNYAIEINKLNTTNDILMRENKCLQDLVKEY